MKKWRCEPDTLFRATSVVVILAACSWFTVLMVQAGIIKDRWTKACADACAPEPVQHCVSMTRHVAKAYCETWEEKPLIKRVEVP
jgi:hypothetical protein